MCYAIIEVRYTATGEPDALVKVGSPEELQTKIQSLQNLGTVGRIRTFVPLATLERKIVWEHVNESEQRPVQSSPEQLG